MKCFLERGSTVILGSFSSRACSTPALPDASQEIAVATVPRVDLDGRMPESHRENEGSDSDLLEEVKQLRVGLTGDMWCEVWRTAVDSVLPTAYVMREVDTFLTVVLGCGLRKEISRVLETRTPSMKVYDWLHLFDSSIYCGVESNSMKDFILLPDLVGADHGQNEQAQDAIEVLEVFGKTNRKRADHLSLLGPANAGRLQAALWQTAGVTPLSMREHRGDGSGINLVLRAYLDWLKALKEARADLPQSEVQVLLGLNTSTPFFSSETDHAETNTSFEDRLRKWRLEQHQETRRANGESLSDHDRVLMDDYLIYQSGFTLTIPVLSRLLVAYRCNVETLDPKCLDEAFDLIETSGVFVQSTAGSTEKLRFEDDPHHYYASLLSLTMDRILVAVQRMDLQVTQRGIEVLHYRISVILPGGVREDMISPHSESFAFIQRRYSNFLSEFTTELEKYDSVPETLLHALRGSVQNCEQLHQSSPTNGEDSVLFAERVSLAAFAIVKFELPQPSCGRSSPDDDGNAFGLTRLRALCGAVDSLIDHNPQVQVQLTSMLICSIMREADHIVTFGDKLRDHERIRDLVEDAADRLSILAGTVPRGQLQNSSLSSPQSIDFNLAHRAVLRGMLTMLCPSTSEESAKTLRRHVDRAYTMVLAHKHHGLVVDAAIVSIFGQVMRKTGDYRLFNLVDICTVQCKQLINEDILEQLFECCAVSGDSSRAKSLLDHLRRDYVGVLNRIDPHTNEHLAELGINRKPPSHMFSKDFYGKWKQGGDLTRELVVSDTTFLHHFPKHETQQSLHVAAKPAQKGGGHAIAGDHRDGRRSAHQGPALEVWFCPNCNARNIGVKSTCYKCHTSFPSQRSNTSFRKDNEYRGRNQSRHRYSQHRDNSSQHYHRR